MFYKKNISYKQIAFNVFQEKKKKRKNTLLKVGLLLIVFLFYVY
jgi:hypothetical protein